MPQLRAPGGKLGRPVAAVVRPRRRLRAGGRSRSRADGQRPRRPLKHFPGLGGAGEDTHYHMSAVYLPAEELRPDLEPFAALSRLAGAVMVGHALYPAYDPSMRPATLSPEVIGGVLRGRLGFDGLAFSDDMEMKALDEWGDLPERCQAAFAAGCDVLMVCHTLEALPEVVERIAHPALAERMADANRRLDTYRQRLITLRSAREYVDFMRNNTQGEKLERVRQALAQIQEGGTRTSTD
ncbi:MAG: hypothetical protein DMF53_21500 [Acidobacteria bacterium]|nr:MAG: hypothetical protein DMF53_21500 [Acidobacteriota bacterium]